MTTMTKATTKILKQKLARKKRKKILSMVKTETVSYGVIVEQGRKEEEGHCHYYY